jgi:hypothetical protein
MKTAVRVPLVTIKDRDFRAAALAGPIARC